MKILNICMGAPFTEGYTYQDNLLSEYQAKLGHEVTVLTTTRTRDANGHITEAAPEDKLLANGVRLIRLKTPGKICQFLGLYPGVSHVIENIAPDFIFIHGLASFVPGAVVRYKQKHPAVRIVADNHQDYNNTYIQRFPYNLQLWFFRQKWRNWINSVEKVYGTTSWRKTFAQKFYGIPAEKLGTLVLGIDSDRLPANLAEVRQRIRKELGIPQDAFVFVTGGKLGNYRCILESLNAFMAIPDESARFLLFGAVLSDVKSEFDRIVSKDSRIIFIGYQNSHEIHNFFIASDFGVFPGLHSVLWEEAIGCGLPCLFRKFEEQDHTEICENCVRIPSPDVDSIHSVLLHVLHDHRCYKKMKRQSQFAAKEYSYHAIAKKSLEMANNSK